MGVILAGCGGGRGSNATPLGRAALPKAVLQPGDLPGSYARFDFGQQRKADSHPGPRADPGRFGRLQGWIARFRREGPATAPGPLVIESRADLFGDAEGAKRDLHAYRDEFHLMQLAGGGNVTITGQQGLGDAAVSETFRQSEVVYYTVAWQENNLTASLTTSGFSRRLTLADTLALARKQAARIAAEG